MADFFLAKQGFCKYQLIWNLFIFHLKPFPTRMQIAVNNFFCSSSGSGDIREKRKCKNQLDVFFCYSLYLWVSKARFGYN